MRASTKCYNSIPLDVLKQPTRSLMVQWLDHAFDEFYTEFEKRRADWHWLTAKENDKVAGFLLIDLEKFPDEVYLAQMVVDPAYQKRGIATTMVKCLFDQFPEAKRLVVITRRANEEAKGLYKALGFTESTYISEGYSRELYTGFEYNNPMNNSVNLLLL